MITPGSTNPLLATADAGGYRIERSLRFDSAGSAYLDRTPASTGNRRTWTWSGWIKLGTNFGTRRMLFGGGAAFVAQTHPNTYIEITDDNVLGIDQVTATTGSLTIRVRTSAVLRDPSAWYHVVVAVDTTQGTDTNRVKMYINGVQQTSFSSTTYPSSNLDTGVNTTTNHKLGSYVELSAATLYFDGYMADINFIDGSTPTTTTRTVGGVTETVLTQFGEFDTDTGVWKPKAYSGSYGTNGFFLKFADSSGTTSTTLGKDSSGNGNNWTPNNFYVGPGTTNAEKAGIDSLVDTPTPYGTDTGTGGEVRGNYATLNPLDSDTITLSNGNLQGFGGSGGTGEVFSTSTIGMSSGKWYCEVLYAAKGSGSALNVGIIEAVTLRTTTQTYPDYGYYSNNGNKYNDLTSSSYGASWDVNDVIGISYDADAGTLVFYKNGSSQGTAFSGLSGTYFFCQARFGSDSHTTQWNFGQRPFAYTAPSGFKALCTQNLPTPTIGATATTRADDYFNTVLYTGTGSSLSVTGVGFQPDWVWIKERSGAADHGLYDAVRGVQKQLESNTTTAETTETTGLTAFNSDGFTVGALAQLNTNTDTYVAWNWKANGAGSSNTQGTITSTVSANTTAGFSIVTYTGNGVVGATRGHGLGVAPSMIFVKGRSNADNWHVYHSALGNTGGLFLNTNAAFTVSSFFWNDTSPSSTVFTTSNGASNNSNGVTYVAYCFAAVAGYSTFGSYTGNGSTDGVFVYTGMRPKFILIKASSITSYWVIFDVARNTYNVMTSQLWPNVSDAENNTYGVLDAVSNGFKLRNTAAGWNDNGATYIYAAFASSPFKFSLAA